MLYCRVHAIHTTLPPPVSASLLRPWRHVQLLSWGPCQFATLGFVVDRAWKIERFVSEDFWSVKMAFDRGQGGGSVEFEWARGR